MQKQKSFVGIENHVERNAIALIVSQSDKSL